MIEHRVTALCSSTHLFADATSAVGCHISTAPADWVRIKLGATPSMLPWVMALNVLESACVNKVGRGWIQGERFSSQESKRVRLSRDTRSRRS